jgi:anti-sigma factor RsiW
MTLHLTPSLLNALADGELSADQLAEVNAHLAQCPACTGNALQQTLLKSATARAGHRYQPPSHLAAHLTQLAQQQNAAAENPPQTKYIASRAPFRLAGWATACALLLLFACLFVFERSAHQASIASAESAALITEACDQHIATLAANAPPQVLSSDRHTVKPWFQGKLPFSFNLPENLPADTRLEGANLTYFHNQPAALLLYSIGKHRVSVFLLQSASPSTTHAPIAEHAGFHVVPFASAALQEFAVSDVDPARLSALANQIQQAQTR